MPRSIAGGSSMRQRWRKSSVIDSAPWAGAGGLMKPTRKSKGKRPTSIAPSTKRARPLLFSSPQLEIATPPTPSYARRFATREPEKITIDQSGSNTAAITHYNTTHETAIILRHAKYLNTLVEQDHRAVKRMGRPMLGFKSFWAARCPIAGIEGMHAIRKGQLLGTDTHQTSAAQFYALAA